MIEACVSPFGQSLGLTPTTGLLITNNYFKPGKNCALKVKQIYGDLLFQFI